MRRVRTLPIALLTAGVLVAGCSGPATRPAAPSAASSGPTSSGPTPSDPARSAGAGAAGLGVTTQGDRTTVTGLPGHPGALSLAGTWRLSAPLDGGAPEGLTPAGALALTGASTGGRSRFLVLAPPYTTPRPVDLPGGFSYDALAPDGSKLYLIEHLPPAGSDHYQVRWYDVPGRRLDEAVVVDKSVLGELMAGRPVSRARSTDGDLVATLYERRGQAPFVHLLHTVETYAQCLDLPASAAPGGYVLAGVDAGTLRITDTSGRLRFQADLAAQQPEISPT